MRLTERLTMRLTPEQDIRETTEIFHNRKFSDAEWSEVWQDLLLRHEYGPQARSLEELRTAA